MPQCPINEDDEPGGAAQGLRSPQTGTWTVASGRLVAAPRQNQTTALAGFDLDVAATARLELEAVLCADSASILIMQPHKNRT